MRIILKRTDKYFWAAAAILLGSRRHPFGRLCGPPACIGSVTLRAESG